MKKYIVTIVFETDDEYEIRSILRDDVTGLKRLLVEKQEPLQQLEQPAEVNNLSEVPVPNNDDLPF